MGKEKLKFEKFGSGWCVGRNPKRDCNYYAQSRLETGAPVRCQVIPNTCWLAFCLVYRETVFRVERLAALDKLSNHA